MSGFDHRITSWMRDHHAVVSSGVLTGAGVSETQRRRLVEHGVLERVVHGAYRFRGVPDDELSRCVALCSSRPRLVVAGPTAGRIWGIRRSPRDQLVHVLAPPASNPCREPWVRVYRTALIDPGDIVHCRDGLRLTSPPRTLVDLARHLSSEALASAVESALHEQLCTLATMQRVARRPATPGRAVGTPVPRNRR